METAVRDGLELRYRDTGAGEPPLVFVHGWCCDQRFFAPQVAHFAPRHRTVALDQLGFGHSDKPRRRYTVEAMADELAWLCAELRIERPVIVGHSLGGAVALAMAARHPQLAAGIALCDPAIFFVDEARSAQADLSRALASDDWQEAARSFAAGALFDEGDDPELRDWIVGEMLRTPRHVMQSAFEELLRFDDESAARRVQIPVLCIAAATPYIDEARFRAACPQVRMEQTPEAGHFHQLLAPDAVNALLEPFVRDCAA